MHRRPLALIGVSCVESQHPRAPPAIITWQFANARSAGSSALAGRAQSSTADLPGRPCVIFEPTTPLAAWPRNPACHRWRRAQCLAHHACNMPGTPSSTAGRNSTSHLEQVGLIAGNMGSLSSQRNLYCVRSTSGACRNVHAPHTPAPPQLAFWRCNRACGVLALSATSCPRIAPQLARRALK